MKKIFLNLVILLAALTCNAQTFSFKTIQQGDINRKEHKLGLVNSENGSFIKINFIQNGRGLPDYWLSRIKNRTYELIKFDSNVNVISKKQYPENDEYSHFYKHFSTKDYIYLIFNRQEKKSDSVTFYLMKFDKLNLDSAKERITIGTFKDVNRRFSYDYDQNFFNITFSSDSSNVLFSASTPQNDYESIYFYAAYSADMKKNWSKELKPKSKGEEINWPMSSFITNNGCIGTFFSNKELVNKKWIEKDTKLIFIDNNGSVKEDIRFGLPNNKVNSVFYVSSKPDEIEIMGLCNNNQSNTANSYYYGVISLSNKQFNLIKKDSIPQSYIDYIYEFHQGKIKKPVEGLTMGYNLCKVINKNGITLVLECNQIQPEISYDTRISQDAHGFTTRTPTWDIASGGHYKMLYSEILVINLTETNSSKISLIPKSSTYGSFIYSEYKNESLLFFQDGGGTLNSNEQICSKAKKDYLCFILAKIDSKGQIKKEGVLSVNPYLTTIKYPEATISGNRLFYINSTEERIDCISYIDFR